MSSEKGIFEFIVNRYTWASFWAVLSWIPVPNDERQQKQESRANPFASNLHIWMQPGRVSGIFTREITSVTFCLLFCAINPFWKRVHSKRNRILSLSSRPLFRREAKTIWQGISPEKVASRCQISDDICRLFFFFLLFFLTNYRLERSL